MHALIFKFCIKELELAPYDWIIIWCNHKHKTTIVKLILVHRGLGMIHIVKAKQMCLGLYVLKLSDILYGMLAHMSYKAMYGTYI